MANRNGHPRRLAAICVLAFAVTGCDGRRSASLLPPGDPESAIRKHVPTGHEAEHHAGEVWAGHRVRHVFAYRNETDNEIRVVPGTGIQTSCGCTHVRLDDHQVSPGMTTKLALEINTAGRLGKVSESATVTWRNDRGDVHRARFQLSADVVSVFVFEPPEIVFRKGELRSGVRKVVRCRANLPIDWRKTRIDARAEFLDIVTEPLEPNASELVLHVQCKSRGPSVGRKATIRLLHSDDEAPEVMSYEGRIPVFAEEYSELSIAPRPITLFSNKDATTWRGYAILTGDLIESSTRLRGASTKHGDVTFQATPLGKTARRVDFTVVGRLDNLTREERRLLLTFENGRQQCTRFRLSERAQAQHVHFQGDDP